NLFDLKEESYKELVLALRREGESKLLMTIETHPQYGKYHWSGHRGCGVRFSPGETKAKGDACPRCGRKLTKGVEQRVEALADREEGFRPPGAAGYVHILPLSEVIAAAYGTSYVDSAQVWQAYNKLVEGCGSEFSVMLDAEPGTIARLSSAEVAEAIVDVREGRLIVEPGYDGVYGKIRFRKLS
ncbi:MAG: DNA helicase UvrD, partial [Thermoproteota archaeon]